MTTPNLSVNSYPRRLCTTANTNLTVTLSPVVGLSQAVDVGRYTVTARLKHQSSAATNGLRCRLAALGGLAGTIDQCYVDTVLTGTALSRVQVAAPNFTTDVVTASVAAAATDQTSSVVWEINVTTAGTLELQFAGEVAGSATCQVNSSLTIEPWNTN